MIKAKIFKYKIIKVKPITELVKFKDHRRLKVFYSKGCVCVNCGLVGTKLGYGMDKNGGFHWDVYTDDFYPLTIDHIIPRSKGGGDELDNLQPMCYKCNSIKGNGDIKIPFETHNINKNRVKLLLKYNDTTFNVGDIVYNCISGKLVGTIIDFKPNNKHPQKELSAVIEGKNKDSLYSLRQLGKLKSVFNVDYDNFKPKPIMYGDGSIQIGNKLIKHM